MCPGEDSPSDASRYADRLKQLRAVATSLQKGHSPGQLRTSFQDALAGATVAVSGSLLLELVAEGVRRETLRTLVEWFGESWPESDYLGADPTRAAGHPLEILRRENEALQLRVDQCRTAMREMPGSSGAFARARDAIRDLSEVDNHYRREEFLLHMRLEFHGLVRPGRILWAAHDEIRQWLKYLALQFASDDFDANKLLALAHSVVEPLLDDLGWLVYLEERLLFPMTLETLDESDWEIIRRHSSKIGWCLVDPGYSDQPPRPHDRQGIAAEGREVSFPTGLLDAETLALIHAALPVDLTFVDGEDRVRYFSEGTRPVFYRSEAILGRDVRCCHPPRSVHYVDQILSDFKSGRETSAQFWKHLGERYIHIRFVAVRDGDGRYLGTLEIAQDITHLKGLEGEQTQLRYDPVV